MNTRSNGASFSQSPSRSSAGPTWIRTRSRTPAFRNDSRATSACFGSSSKVWSRPPSPTARARAMPEYPPSVPISTALRAPAARASTSRWSASMGPSWISGSPAFRLRSRVSWRTGSSGRKTRARYRVSLTSGLALKSFTSVSLRGFPSDELAEEVTSDDDRAANDFARRHRLAREEEREARRKHRLQHVEDRGARGGDVALVAVEHAHRDDGAGHRRIDRRPGHMALAERPDHVRRPHPHPDHRDPREEDRAAELDERDRLGRMASGDDVRHLDLRRERHRAEQRQELAPSQAARGVAQDVDAATDSAAP